MRSEGPARLRLRLRSAAEAKVRAGHPWVFAESVRDQNRGGELGEFAVIYDRHDEFMALGLYDPDSPLRVRVLHCGKPVTLDLAWWRNRLVEGLRRREGLFGEDTTGYRVLNGESDGWPGFVLDRYGSTWVVKLYTGAWLPRMEEWLPLLREQICPHQVVLRLSRNLQETAREKFHLGDGQVIAGPGLDGPVLFLETGLKFEADVVRGQKTGFFLDQRENRRLVEGMARGRDVLNAFSFSSGFSVYAARGGARRVVDVDISAHALASGGRNFERNIADPGVAACRREAVQADVFEWLQVERRRFGVVIVDPPALAKREREREGALRAYYRLARGAIDRVEAKGTLVMASCSAQISEEEFCETVCRAAGDSGRRWAEIKRTGQPSDHPARFPEARYLKCLFLRVER